jgi:pSer/pThr/pTyr-binding forkhead associated (FHA) protein
MLKIRLKNNKHNAVWLVEPKVSIGRAGENDFVVDDPSIAANHVDIQVSHENLTLVNVSGSKQVTINGKVIEQSSPLKADDVLVIGSVELEVVDPKREPRPAAAATAPTSDTQAPSGWALKSNHTALANRVFAIKAETVIGRSNDCDITLAAAHLSRRHVKLSIQEGLLYVKDLGSANGTYLNGKRVVGEERVRRGDELRFDTLSFGVIGPAQDMDKTTVRPIPTIQPPPKAAAPAPQRPAKAAPVKVTSAPVRTPISDNAAAKSGAVQVESGGSKGTLLWVVAVVIAVAVGIGVAFQQGLFG